jgi:hypothetical protein
MRAMVDGHCTAGQRRLRERLRGQPDGVAESVRMAVATGVAGLSIEDSTGDPDDPLRDLPDAGRAAARGPRLRSTPPAATRCWSVARKTSSSAGPISTTR